MKKSILSIAFIVLLLAAFNGCSNVNGNKSNSTSAVTGNSVSISNFQFSPAVLTINVGDTVEWTNNDSATHTVVFDNFKSGSINQGGNYKHTFDTKGTFKYTCGIHPSMKGSIEVK